jgi:hypothetical protein
MSARTLLTHLVVAALAFALGWSLSRGGPEAPSRQTVADADPAAAFAEILRIDDPRERTLALVSFFDRTDPSSAIMLRDVLTATESGLIVDEIAETLFAAWWAEADPAAAFANVVDPAWADRHPWVRTVTQEWVRRDPLAAVAAVESLPPGPTRGRLEAARVLLDEWFVPEDFADPTPLVGLVRQFELKPRARAVEHMLDRMIDARGIEATERFVEALPPDSDSIGVSIQQEFMARMGVALLDHDIARAQAWAAKHGHGREGVGVLKHLAYYWALKDGPAAMTWAMDLPDTPERAGVIKRAWISFGHADPEGARSWLHAREPDDLLLGIYARHLRHLVQEDPDRALELAQKASDPAVRERMLVALGRGWMRSDPEAAGAWLANGGLSKEVQEQIRSAPGAGPRGPSSS